MDRRDDLDVLMGYLGDFGGYQCFQFLLHILSALTAGLHMLSLVTVAAVPEHRCEIPDVDINGTMSNLTFSELLQYIPAKDGETLDSCLLYNQTTNATYSCSSWVYNTTYYQSSRSMEWNLVCDTKWMGAFAQTSYMLGVFFGCMTLGNLSDKFGRKPVFCWSALLQLILGVGVAFIPTYIPFICIRFLYGIFGSAGAYLPGFVLTMELVGASKRSMCGIAFQAVFALGIMLVAVWGAFIKERQLLQVIYGLHGLLLIGHFWLMDESPRWLWANGRHKEAVEIVKKALKFNRSRVQINAAEFVSRGAAQQRTAADEGGVLDLFRTSNLRKKTLNICLCWFANSLVYYGLSLSTGNMKGDPYVLLFIMAIIEIPSYMLTVLLMDRLGRRFLVSFDMICGGICCIVAISLVKGSSVSIGFVFLGKFLVASSFAIIFNYSAELFPTVIRNSALGLGGMFARISGALTPLITLLDSLDPKIPSLIFAIIALLSGFLVMFLPETLGKEMPNTIEDGEKFGVGDNCFTSCLKSKVAETDQLEPKLAMTEQLKPLNATEKA